MNVNITVFKNVSQKNGKVYYSASINQVVYGVLLKSTCFVSDYDVKKLVENGVELVDMTKKNK